MMGIDWGLDSDPSLYFQEMRSQKQRQEEIIAKQRAEEERRRAVDRQMAMMTMGSCATYSTRQAPEPLSLRGIRDAITTMKEKEEEPSYDFTQVSKWMEEAYDKLLTPMSPIIKSRASGFTNVNRKDLEADFEYRNKFFNIGMEPNFYSGLKAKKIFEDECPRMFGQTNEDKERKDLMDLIIDVVPDEAPMAKMFASSGTATEHAWAKYDAKEKEDNSKAHELFWQSYRRTGKLPFTATHK